MRWLVLASYAGRIIAGRRLPAVAGLFYEADAEALKAQIEAAFRHPLGPGYVPEASSERRRESLGFLVPHAGYMYSGPIAVHAYAKMALEGSAETYVIVGPNHTGLGASVSVYPGTAWSTPLGELQVDTELARVLVKASSYAELDEKAHLYEHSVEVQLPFLQYLFNARVRILPVVVYEQTPEVARDIAEALVEAVEKTGRDVVFIATSNLTHYEPYEAAVEKDKKVIDAIISLNAEELYRIVTSTPVSMCGPAAAMALIYYARLRDARGVELLKYATSGDVAGDKKSVVGYAAIRVY
ncbi:AmmeMemoRadiSam system protein B [Hyperthermus butylicus]|uniref:MEMO1 family protein Hbut_0536 n=1 Tax=Hyperthermus butylicus (strain DSM 5456 / JCM 9403 / PLM1-5) TaxID=415426 RepID=A2BK85_HYPBU|nr:AmmeMemoRadiSam system protein B [Hyperthermus butylicus]ABM80396.1 universally conserved protein [Hyperthermus butylicus DSM 5456]